MTSDFTDLPLFTQPGPANAVDTSRDTERRMRPMLGGLRLEVFETIGDAMGHGMTADEIEAARDLKAQTVTARLWELEGRNRKFPLFLPLITKTNRRRPTRSGCPARVYVLTGFGVEVYEKLKAVP